MFLHVSVSHSAQGRRACHARPHYALRMPPAFLPHMPTSPAMHTPRPRMPPCPTHPTAMPAPPGTHACLPCHAYPLGHTCPPRPCTPPVTHAPLPCIPPTTLRHAVNERAVRILLECILVSSKNTQSSQNRFHCRPKYFNFFIPIQQSTVCKI